jgi:hypothetical protein
MSMETLYPNGPGYNLTGRDLTTGFAPCPDYASIAVAAGGAWGTKVEKYEALEDAIVTGIGKVRDGVSAVIDCLIQRV